MNRIISRTDAVRASPHPTKLENAIASKFKDFEDAVLHAAACHAGAKYIVTRNIVDFKNSTLPVFEPREFIDALELLKNNNYQVKESGRAEETAIGF